MASGDKAKIAASGIVLEPISEAEAAPNSLFIDEETGQVKTKTNGAPVPITQQNSKLKKNGHTGQVSGGVPISLLPSGLFVPTDSDLAQGQKLIGITLGPSNPDEFIGIHLIVSNVVGALLGKGFTSGDQIYISQQAGQYTSDFNSFTGNDDKIIRIGVADCSDNEASAVAKDLILFPEVILLPSV